VGEERKHNVASPFKMSKKTYQPKAEEFYQQDLQKSVMGISFKDLKLNTLQRDSLIKMSPRKLSARGANPFLEQQDIINQSNPKIFEEFFIIGINKEKVTLE